MSDHLDEPTYAGFWRRAAASLLDFLLLLPTTALQVWLMSRVRLYPLYAFVPNMLFGVFLHVYLVKRFGGTPGKLLMALRITSIDGSPVTWMQAFLRNAPELLLGLFGGIVSLVALSRLSDAEFHALSLVQRAARIGELAPHALRIANTVRGIWTWSELIVLLTNRKRRALHDFIAGTVVIRRPFAIVDCGLPERLTGGGTRHEVSVPDLRR